MTFAPPSNATNGQIYTYQGSNLQYENGHWRRIGPGLNVREILQADRTYYVATTGDDTNDGLSTGSAFATIQHAWDSLADLDCQNYLVTIQVADGTYDEDSIDIYRGPISNRPWGDPAVFILGNTTTPANCVLASSNIGSDVFRFGDCSVNVGGFKFEHTGASPQGEYFQVNTNAYVEVTNPVIFSDTAWACVTMYGGGRMFWDTDFSIDQGSGESIYRIFWLQDQNNHIDWVGTHTVTMIGSPGPNYSQFIDTHGVNNLITMESKLSFTGSLGAAPGKCERFDLTSTLR